MECKDDESTDKWVEICLQKTTRSFLRTFKEVVKSSIVSICCLLFILFTP